MLHCVYFFCSKSDQALSIIISPYWTIFVSPVWPMFTYFSWCNPQVLHVSENFLQMWLNIPLSIWDQWNHRIFFRCFPCLDGCSRSQNAPLPPCARACAAMATFRPAAAGGGSLDEWWENPSEVDIVGTNGLYIYIYTVYIYIYLIYWQILTDTGIYWHILVIGYIAKSKINEHHRTSPFFGKWIILSTIVFYRYVNGW